MYTQISVAMFAQASSDSSIVSSSTTSLTSCTDTSCETASSMAQAPNEQREQQPQAPGWPQQPLAGCMMPETPPDPSSDMRGQLWQLLGQQVTTQQQLRENHRASVAREHALFQALKQQHHAITLQNSELQRVAGMVRAQGQMLHQILTQLQQLQPNQQQETRPMRQDDNSDDWNANGWNKYYDNYDDWSDRSPRW